MPAKPKPCFHCGLSIPGGPPIYADVPEQRLPMCCLGCKAVTEAIFSAGLHDYYTQRLALPTGAVVPEILQTASKWYDDPEMLATYCTSDADQHHVVLMLEGITCAACVWLIEQHLAVLPGIKAVKVNYTTLRADVRWQDGQTSLAAIINRISTLGYKASPYDRDRGVQSDQTETRRALWRLLIAALAAAQSMMVAIPMYLVGTEQLDPGIAALLKWTGFVLASPVLLYAAMPFYRAALNAIHQGEVTMDVPIVIAITTAFAASSWAMLSGQGDVYFDSVTMFVFFLLLGRYFELRARLRAKRIFDSTFKFIPQLAYRQHAIGKLEELPAARLSVEDLILVRPGDLFAADGIVHSGRSQIDESLIHGEAKPVNKQPGDTVIAGTVNLDNPLTVRVSAVGERTQLGAIKRLMENAATGQPRWVRWVDRIAHYFLSLVLVLAALTYLSWLLIDSSQALWVAVSVLIIACPCALSLATPVTLTIATARMAQNGVVVSHQDSIEKLAQVRRFVFDKTGTLTQGQPTIIARAIWQQNEEALGIVAASLEQFANHPLAHAFTREIPTTARHHVDDVLTASGQGVVGTIDGQIYAIGQRDWLQTRYQLPPPPTMAANTHHAFYSLVYLVSAQDGWLAGFQLADQIRPDAASVLTELQRYGTLAILSGDRTSAVAYVGQHLNVPHGQGRLTPADKLNQVRHWQQQGMRVAAIGDGQNDGPLLTQADVGLAMAKGAHFSQAGADMRLLTDQLTPIVQAVRLAHFSRRVLRQNLTWALCYNTCALPFAMVGWVSPWLAAIGMSASALVVLLNSLRQK